MTDPFPMSYFWALNWIVWGLAAVALLIMIAAFVSWLTPQIRIWREMRMISRYDRARRQARAELEAKHRFDERIREGVAKMNRKSMPTEPQSAPSRSRVVVPFPAARRRTDLIGDWLYYDRGERR